MSSASEPGKKSKKILQNILAFGVLAVVCLAIVAYSGIRRFARNPGGYWFSKGLQYDLGNGVTQDYVKARNFYQKAAGAGNTQAMNNLGTLYEQGQGGPLD
jgi:hypothetical protein